MSILELPESVVVKFIKNTITLSGGEHLVELLESGQTARECIVQGFSWDESIEGEEFWINVSSSLR